MHQSTQNVSINIDPLTGQPDLFQFLSSPPNPGSLSDFAAGLPAHLFDRTIFELWYDEEDSEVLTPEEMASSAQDLFSLLGGFGSDPALASSSPTSFVLKEELACAPVGIEETAAGSATAESRASGSTADKELPKAANGNPMTAPTPSPYGGSRKDPNHWLVEEIVQQSRDGKAALMVGDWKQALPSVIPAGQTYELLVLSGLLAMVEAVLIQSGRISLQAIASQGIDRHFPEFLLDEIRTRMEGGDIELRLQDVRSYIRQDLKAVSTGKKELSIPNAITLEELDRCEELVDEVLASIESNRKPKREDLLSVLHFLVIKSKHQRIFKMTQDYAVRRLGWIDEETPRADKKAKAARDRLLRRMSWVWEDADNCKLPLIRRLEKGHLVAGGSNKPSTYEMLWENWGGPFARLADSLSEAA